MSLRRPRSRRELTIKMHFKVIWWEGVDWIRLAQYRYHLRALVGFREMMGIIWLVDKIFASQDGFSSRKLLTKISGKWSLFSFLEERRIRIKYSDKVYCMLMLCILLCTTIYYYYYHRQHNKFQINKPMLLHKHLSIFLYLLHVSTQQDHHQVVFMIYY
jgi:hypothetical protein